MKERNKNNSIVFLTTLSVYLGLVLVGGTPFVMAQAALTRQEYETKSAKENKDELNKPLSDANLYIPQIIQLINELNSLSKNQGFDWNELNHYKIEGLGFCESDNSPSYEVTGYDGKFPEVFDNFSIKLGREISKRRVAAKLGDFYSQRTGYDFSTVDSTFLIKTTVENKNSQETKVFLNEVVTYFGKFASFPISSMEKVVYENTKVSSENNQIFIVTRLPRGSLNELLKQNAKADNQ